MIADQIGCLSSVAVIAETDQVGCLCSVAGIRGRGPLVQVLRGAVPLPPGDARPQLLATFPGTAATAAASAGRRAQYVRLCLINLSTTE